MVTTFELITSILPRFNDVDQVFTKDQLFTLFCYMIITKEQESLIIENPNQFISDEDEDFTDKDLKNWICELKEELIDQRSLLGPVLEVKDMFLSNNNPLINEVESEGLKNYFYMKCCEIGLYLFGDLIEDALKLNYIEDLKVDQTITDIIIPALKEDKVTLSLQIR